MKANLDENGVMQIIPETSNEAYALKHWKNIALVSNNEVEYWQGSMLTTQLLETPTQPEHIHHEKNKPLIVETEDWKLGAFVDWQAKKHTEPCPICHGTKEIGGGFKSLDGPRQCENCFGMGHINKGPSTSQPELPDDLIEHMRRAWWDFINKK